MHFQMQRNAKLSLFQGRRQLSAWIPLRMRVRPVLGGQQELLRLELPMMGQKFPMFWYLIQNCE